MAAIAPPVRKVATHDAPQIQRGACRRPARASYGIVITIGRKIILKGALWTRALGTDPGPGHRIATGRMAVKLSTLCLYCNLPFGQGDHSHCLKRLRRLKLVEGQRLVTVEVFYLTSQRYRSVAVKTCWCGEIHRWRGNQCKAHTRAWVNRYGGRLRTMGSERARFPLKQGVHKAEAEAA